MDYSREIKDRVQEYLKGEEVEVGVLQVQGKLTYTIWIKKRADGSVIDPEMIVKKLIPDAFPYSGVGMEGEWMRHSFYLTNGVPNWHCPNNYEL